MCIHRITSSARTEGRLGRMLCLRVENKSHVKHTIHLLKRYPFQLFIFFLYNEMYLIVCYDYTYTLKFHSLYLQVCNADIFNIYWSKYMQILQAGLVYKYIDLLADPYGVWIKAYLNYLRKYQYWRMLIMFFNENIKLY